MSDKNNPHIAGQYAIIVALIGLIGTFGAVYLSYYLEKKEKTFDKEVQGAFLDKRDGQTYKWVRLKDGKKWMAENLNYIITDSWYYDNKLMNCAKYGRLYNWQDGIKNCPDGWRLPTDYEWWKMASFYGGASNRWEGQYVNDYIEDEGKTAYQTLIKGGNSGFSAMFGGNRREDGYLNGFETFGNYWSSTRSTAPEDLSAWTYFFSNKSNKLRRGFEYKNSFLSCRCIQD